MKSAENKDAHHRSKDRSNYVVDKISSIYTNVSKMLKAKDRHFNPNSMEILAHDGTETLRSKRCIQHQKRSKT